LNALWRRSKQTRWDWNQIFELKGEFRIVLYSNIVFIKFCTAKKDDGILTTGTGTVQYIKIFHIFFRYPRLCSAYAKKQTWDIQLTTVPDPDFAPLASPTGGEDTFFEVDMLNGQCHEMVIEERPFEYQY
jgi:hypothetical protein